jgi:Zn-finger nucleic acid-binding protein
MNAVTARANPGSLIELDQCPRCGGIWCDKWELFPIRPDEAAKLEPVDQALLRAPTPGMKRTLYCPRCTAQLVIPRNPMLGPDLQFRRCPKCDGIWLNRGQLTRYKMRQRQMRMTKMGSEAIVRNAVEIYQDPKSWIVTGTGGMFAQPRGVEENSEPLGESLRASFKLALQALLRIVLGI